MKLGVLQCDQVSDGFIAEHGRYPEMFARLFKDTFPAMEYTIFDTEHGEFPNDIHEVDAYLITGSRHCVNDNYPWVAKLEEFVRTLHKAKKKLIGICFGHQMIAKALGGKVIQSPNGWGIGMSQNTIVLKKQWMDPALDQFNLLVSHQDQVVELPEQAEVLASSEFCPNYMMQVNQHFLSIQGHPEHSKAYSQALMTSRQDILDPTLFARGIQSLELAKDDAKIAQWLVNFLQAPV